MAENRQVGVIYSPWVEEAEPLAKSLLVSLSKEHKPWVCSVLDLEGNTEMAKRCSTFITIGGDGTILRTVRLAAPAGIPIVGVNLGRVGFMAELPADDAVARVNSFARGEGWLEERTMLEAQILPVRQSTKKLRSYSGLNDAVVSRTKPSRMVYVEVRVDEHVQGVIDNTFRRVFNRHDTINNPSALDFVKDFLDPAHRHVFG